MEIEGQVVALNGSIVLRWLEHRNAILAKALGGVHGGIGISEQLRCRLTWSGKGHTNAGMDGNDPPGGGHRRTNCGQELLSDGGDLLKVAYARQHDGELIATKPRRSSIRRNSASEATAERHQKFVAGRVPQTVVDCFEIIEIHEQHCGGLAVVRLFQGVPYDASKHRAVGETREFVVICLVGEALFHPPELVEELLEPAVFERRRDVLCEGLKQHHIVAIKPRDISRSVADEQESAGPAVGP